VPAGALNNVATQNTYVDALTVVFAYERPRGFTVQVNNAAVFYQLAWRFPTQRDYTWESGEHFIQPAIAGFRDPVTEGLPPGSVFAGIRLRSGATGVPARVTVA